MLSGVCLLSEATAETMRHLTIRDGLTGESVFKIFKDRDGYIWLGTTNGVNRYNGLTLQSYNLGPRRQLNTVQDIAQTSDGLLYVATYGGLFRKDDRHGRMDPVCKEIDCAVIGLAADGGTLYIATERGLYVLRQGNRLTHYMANTNVMSKQNNLRDVFVDAEHRVWLASHAGLERFDSRSGKVVFYDASAWIDMMGVWTTVTAVGPYVYLGTSNDGLIRYDIRRHRFEHYVDVGCNLIRELSTDGKHLLYVATDGGGVQVVDLNEGRVVRSITTSTQPCRLEDNTVYSYLHDPTGIDWMGYYRLGFSYTYHTQAIFSTYKFGTFTTEGLNVRCFCIDGPRKLIGTRQGFWFVDEHRGLIRHYGPDLLGASIVISICRYKERYCIATFDGGVRMFDPVTLQLSPLNGDAALRKGSFTCVCSYGGDLWLSGNLGVFCLSGATGQVVNYSYHNSGLLNAVCMQILFDHSGKAWIPTLSGLCLLDPASRTVQSGQSLPKGFPSGDIDQHFALGPSGYIVGFNPDGLLLAKEDLSAFTRRTLPPQVMSDACQFVQYDGHGHYWTATESGLFRFDRQFREFSQYGGRDGMNATEFNTLACFIDTAQHLYIGSAQGLLCASLPRIDEHHFATCTPVVIDEAAIDNTALSAEALEQLAVGRTVNIPWNGTSSTFSFRPILLDYSNTSNTFYQYRIDHGAWLIADGSQRITLPTHLWPGSHTLQIRLSGAGSRFTTYMVHVYPNGAAISELIVVLVLFILVYSLLYQWNTRKRKLRNPASKYGKARLDEAESAAIADKLQRHLLQSRAYLDPNLKLTDVAKAIGCSGAKLSQVLSQQLGQNYYDYVNHYRLEEFKRRMASADSHKYTLTALAEQCGFKRTSFFSTFKRETGTTPTEYQQKLEEDGDET